MSRDMGMAVSISLSTGTGMTKNKIYQKIYKIYLTKCEIGAMILLSIGNDGCTHAKEAVKMSMERAIGFVVGIVAAAVLALIARKIVARRGGATGEYDERQQVVRGRAFTLAYAVIMVYLAVWMVLRNVELPFFNHPSSVLVGILLSVTVFVGYSVFNDAYFRTSDRPGTYIALIGAVGLLNLILGIRHWVRETTLEGRLLDNANLMVAAMMIAVMACVVIKLALDRRSEAN